MTSFMRAALMQNHQWATMGNNRLLCSYCPIKIYTENPMAVTIKYHTNLIYVFFVCFYICIQLFYAYNMHTVNHIVFNDKL